MAALVLPFPFSRTLQLYSDCLAVAVFLVLAAVPFIVIGYEICSAKGRAR